MKQPPSQLRDDNDGHWYLVPEDRITEFEDILNMMDEGDDDLDLSDFHQVDGPHHLRILAWEEIS